MNSKTYEHFKNIQSYNYISERPNGKVCILTSD